MPILAIATGPEPLCIGIWPVPILLLLFVGPVFPVFALGTVTVDNDDGTAEAVPVDGIFFAPVGGKVLVAVFVVRSGDIIVEGSVDDFALAAAAAAASFAADDANALWR